MPGSDSYVSSCMRVKNQGDNNVKTSFSKVMINAEMYADSPGATERAIPPSTGLLLPVYPGL